MTIAPRLLTDAVARNANPRAREYAIADSRLKGFALRVIPSGVKSWILRTKIGGKHRRITLGTAPEMDADEARALAHQAMARDAPQAAARRTEDEKPPITFKALAQHYLNAKTPGWRPSTERAFRIYLRAQLLPAFGTRLVSKLTTAEIAEWFFAYSAKRPGGANHALTHFRCIVKFGRENGYLPRKAPDPSHPIRRNVRPSRGRLLNTEQLAAIGAWLDHPPEHWRDVAEAIRLIILTGCRSGEIARLRWSEVKEDRLLLASTKTGARDVLLSRPALAILERRKSASAHTRYVFPHRDDWRRPLSSLDGPWRCIRARIGLSKDIRLHDLRHTYASHAIMSGETLDMAGRLLGHRQPHTTEIYAHLDAGYLAEAADRVSGVVAEMMK
jgi:integrase